VIGVHTPKFSSEKEPANVQNAVHELKVVCPIAIDSKYKIWNAFNNEYWPAQVCERLPADSDWEQTAPSKPPTQNSTHHIGVCLNDRITMSKLTAFLHGE
jgi:hypothetical protein